MSMKHDIGPKLETISDALNECRKLLAQPGEPVVTPKYRWVYMDANDGMWRSPEFATLDDANFWFEHRVIRTGWALQVLDWHEPQVPTGKKEPAIECTADDIEQPAATQLRMIVGLANDIWVNQHDQFDTLREDIRQCCLEITRCRAYDIGALESTLESLGSSFKALRDHDIRTDARIEHVIEIANTHDETMRKVLSAITDLLRRVSDHLCSHILDMRRELEVLTHNDEGNAADRAALLAEVRKIVADEMAKRAFWPLPEDAKKPNVPQTPYQNPCFAPYIQMRTSGHTTQEANPVSDPRLLPCACGEMPEITFHARGVCIDCPRCGIGTNVLGARGDAQLEAIRMWNRWTKSPTFAAEAADSRHWANVHRDTRDGAQP